MDTDLFLYPSYGKKSEQYEGNQAGEPKRHAVPREKESAGRLLEIIHRGPRVEEEELLPLKRDFVEPEPLGMLRVQGAGFAKEFLFP